MTAPAALPASAGSASSASSATAPASVPVKAAPSKSGVAKPVAAQFVGLTVVAAKELALQRGGKEHRALISEIKAMLKVGQSQFRASNPRFHHHYLNPAINK